MVVEEVLKYKTLDDFSGFNWENDYTDTLLWLHDLRAFRGAKHVAHDVVLVMVEACPQYMKAISIEQAINRKPEDRKKDIYWKKIMRKEEY